MEQEEEYARFRLLETVRQYAQDSLLEGGEAETVRERLMENAESQAARDRHRDYFLALAEQCMPQNAEDEKGARSDHVEQEHENMRVALAWSLEQPQGSEISQRLAGGLCAFWRHRGHFREGRDWLARALQQEGTTDETVHARALNAASIMSIFLGDMERAEVLSLQSLTLYHKVGNNLGLHQKRSHAPDDFAANLTQLAYLEYDENHAERAARLLGAVEKISEEISMPLAPVERPEYEKYLEDIHSKLGAEAYDAAWAEGRAMTMAKAVGYALSEWEY